MDREIREEVGKYFNGKMYDEMYDAIVCFLSSCEIYESKYEGNEILINMLDRKTALVYKEYELHNGSFECSHSAKYMIL